MRLRLWMALALAVLLSVPVGCKNDDDGAGIGGPNAAADLAAHSEFSDDDIRHFLGRAEWGVTPQSFATAKQIGVSAYIDQMLDFQPTPQLEADAMSEHVEDPQHPDGPEVTQYWLHLMQNTSQPFQETMAMFWHNHFVVGQQHFGPQNQYWMFLYIQMLREKGVANLRDLLFAVATDWAMIRYLDSHTSTKGDPNENFAREFFELFTLGVDNGYEQKDIVEAARAFTGYRIRTDVVTGIQTVEFEESRHDLGYKTVLGHTVVGRIGPTGYMESMDVIDIVLNHSAAAEFICKKLFEYFCYRDAEPEIVAALAAQLRAANFELKPVIKTILMSRAFYGERSREGQVKAPLEFIFGFIRSTGLKAPEVNLDFALEDAGHRPCFPPNVEGWPGGELWLSAQGMIERANMLRECVFQTAYQAGLGFDIASTMPAADSADAVVDHFAQLLRVDLSPADRATLIDYMNSNRDPATGARIADPFDPATDIEERVRGLLYILAQHPSFNVR